MYNLNKNTIRTFERNKSEVIWTVRYHLYPRFGVSAPGALRAICRTLRGMRNNGTPSNWPGRLISLKGHLKVICFWFLEISITLFSLHAQMETGIPICHGRERSTEEAMETAERYGCLTIKLAIIAMNGSIGADDTWKLTFFFKQSTVSNDHLTSKSGKNRTYSIRILNIHRRGRHLDRLEDLSTRFLEKLLDSYLHSYDLGYFRK